MAVIQFGLVSAECVLTQFCFLRPRNCVHEVGLLFCGIPLSLTRAVVCGSESGILGLPKLSAILRRCRRKPPAENGIES